VEFIKGEGGKREVRGKREGKGEGEEREKR